MLPTLLILSLCSYLGNSLNFGDFQYVPPVTNCRQCDGRSLNLNLDSQYVGLGQKKSPKFLFAEAPCCEVSLGLLKVEGCGVGKPAIPRISGGQGTTDNSQIPWTCELMKLDPSSTTDNDGYMSIGCGATLISCDPGILITSASCFKGTLPKFDLSTIDRAVPTTWLYAACGRKERVSAPGDNQLQFVPAVFSKDLVKVHADFNKNGNNENDIALVRTTKPYKCKKDRINAACLPTDEKLKDVTNWDPAQTIVAGFGNTDTASTPTQPGVLQYVKVKPVSNADCKTKYTGLTQSQPDTIQDNMVCSEILSGSTGDACAGDEGGPLVTKISGEADSPYHVVGITSTPRCDVTAGGPSIYTEVFPYLSWIQTEAKALEEVTIT